MSYVDGFVIAVPAANKEAFREMAERVGAIFLQHGATRLLECWGDDVPDGKVTDFRGAVKAKEDEIVVFAWIEWPSKEVRDAGQKKVSEDMSMSPGEIPFDGMRMIYGGFRPIVDLTA